MKTLETLEQEAKQAREVAIATTDNPFELMSTKVDSIITASVAMMTYQLALSHEAIDCVPGNSDSCDGWIEWKGGDCPVKSSKTVEVKFRLQTIKNDIDLAGVYRWNHADKSGRIDGIPQCDIIAYRIVK